MNIEQMLAVLDADIVERLKTAIEIGKWSNGVPLTQEQRQICMQAVIAWEHQNIPEKQRTGYIEKPQKDDDACDSHEPEIKPIRFI